MFEDDIKKYYSRLEPDKNTQQSLIKKVKAQKNRRALVRLALQSACAAAACFLLALGINYVAPPSSAPTVNPDLATVMALPSGYVIAGLVLAALVAFFTGRYITKRRGAKK